MFDWTSFGTGFAKAGSEKLDKDEEEAKALGASQVKSMYENYASVVKENRTLSNDIREKINVVKGFAPDATDDQLVALAQDRGILDMLSTRLKDKDFDPSGFNINNFVKVTEASGSPYGAEARINELFTIPSAVNSASAAFQSIAPAPEKEGFFSSMTRGGREKQARASAEQTAAALGVPLEKLQGAMGYRRDIKPSGASYDLASLKPGDTLDVSIDKAGVKLAAARKSGDKKDVELAQAILDNFIIVKESLSSPQQQWLNKVSRLKELEISGTPQQKESAVKELDAIFAAEKRAELAKQLPKAQRENMLAKLEIDAASDDPEVAEPALAQLLKEAGVQAKVTEAKQTTTQQRDNYLADLELKAKGQRGTEAEQVAAQAKLVEMKKLDKLVAEAGQTDTQARDNRLAALRTKADGGDLEAKAELEKVAAIDKALDEVKQTPAQKLTNMKADLTSKAAAGDKDAEKQLQAFFAIEGQEARAKEGDVAQRNNRIAALQTTITTSTNATEVKDAKAKMAKELKLIADEARARQVPTAASDKVPSLGALNSHVAVAVAQAVQNKHGNLKNDMAIINKPNGDGTTYQDYDYIGDDPTKRQLVTDTKIAAAKKALSVFTDNNGKPLDRNVQAVMNTWIGSAAAPEKKGGLGSKTEAAPAAAVVPASTTTTTGSGNSTVVIVTDKEGKQFKFEGKDAARRAAGFKEAKGLK
jgi:hypothetical protein